MLSELQLSLMLRKPSSEVFSKMRNPVLAVIFLAKSNLGHCAICGKLINSIVVRKASYPKFLHDV